MPPNDLSKLTKNPKLKAFLRKALPIDIEIDEIKKMIEKLISDISLQDTLELDWNIEEIETINFLIENIYWDSYKGTFSLIDEENWLDYILSDVSKIINSIISISKIINKISKKSLDKESSATIYILVNEIEKLIDNLKLIENEEDYRIKDYKLKAMIKILSLFSELFSFILL